MALRLVVQFSLWLVFTGALLFGSAGTLDWQGAWIFLAEMAVCGMAVGIWLLHHDPDLLRERLALPFQKEQVFADKVLMLVLLGASCGWMVLMGLDAKRWALSGVPEELSAAGTVLIFFCFLITWVTFRENSFAVPVIKLQPERRQKTVATGPYSFVRHPMYAGAVLYFIGAPLLLGSWLGLLCAPLLTAALIVRIWIEERLLRKNLDGYFFYASQVVHHRLLPGIW